MSFSHSPPPPCQWFSQLSAALDRRTITSWIRAAGLCADYKPVYTTVAAAGKGNTWASPIDLNDIDQ
jgi:hypothetical protein